MALSHDQNFENLILDYPVQALQFSVLAEAEDIDEQVSIEPIRHERLKDRLGNRFFELGAPLEVSGRDGRRGARNFSLCKEIPANVYPARGTLRRMQGLRGRACRKCIRCSTALSLRWVRPPGPL